MVTSSDRRRPGRRPRRHRPEPEALDRWMVSYADFITLLFAFFVVMYAMSSISESKYEELARDLAARFRALAPGEAPARPGGMPAGTGVPGTPDAPAGVPGFTRGRVPEPPPAAPGPTDTLDRMATDLRTNLRPLIDEGRFRIRRTGRRIEVEIQSGVLFPSGSPRPADPFVAPLESVARVIRETGHEVRVEGFTDDVPITGGPYASNWELSAARAATVVRLFSELGIDPARLAAVGYGEHRPVASNDTPEGRARNRRVVILIGRGEQAASP
jgi:chemotaxis protein MotB